jgi:hypothetical protein
VCGLSGCIYTPNLNFSGTDSFIYQACDPSGACDTAIATITIGTINDFPQAINDSGSTNEEIAIDILVLDNDTDLDGDIIIVSGLVTPPSNGTVSCDIDSCSYTPNTNFH